MATLVIKNIGKIVSGDIDKPVLEGSVIVINENLIEAIGGEELLADIGGATVVDVNQCVGCGLCTTRCEFDAIHLERDVPEASTMRRSEDKLKYILPNGAKQAIKVRLHPKTEETWE